MNNEKMNSKALLFLAMVLASILLSTTVVATKDKVDKNDDGIDESKYYGGWGGYGGPWRGGYGGWRGGYGGWGGPWRGGYGGWGGPWRGGYGGWGGGWPAEHGEAHIDKETNT